MNYVAIVTARAGSERLESKNLYPLGSRSLIEISAQHGIDAGLPVIISSDMPEAKSIAEKMGASYVDIPDAFKDGNSHMDQINDALEKSGYEGYSVVLLQPTSPFRVGGVIKKCIDAHKSSTEGSWVVLGRDGYRLTEDGYSKSKNIAGSVMVFGPKLLREGKPLIVDSPIINLLEIDSEEEYAEACAIFEQIRPITSPVLDQFANEAKEAINKFIPEGEQITLVGRPDGNPIPQDKPVAYINQCQGYDGGRCDVLFLVANDMYKILSDMDAVKECLSKAKVVIIRDHKYGYKLLSMLPATDAEIVVIRYTASPEIDQSTTGAISSFLLFNSGLDVTRVGFSSPGKRARDYQFDSDHWKGTSYDNILLSQTGRNR